MTKKEIRQAIGCVQLQIKTFQDWVQQHPDHPANTKLEKDISVFQERLKELDDQDKNTYPTYQELADYSDKELMIILRTLPTPETELQELVIQMIYRRIKGFTIQS